MFHRSPYTLSAESGNSVRFIHVEATSQPAALRFASELSRHYAASTLVLSRCEASGRVVIVRRWF